MLKIPCPYCGTRNQDEFSHHGEAHIMRPKNPEKLSETEWGDYLFFRKNIKGDHAELWMHRHGCRKFFNVLRNTVSDKIISVYKIGEKPRVSPAKKGVKK